MIADLDISNLKPTKEEIIINDCILIVFSFYYIVFIPEIVWGLDIHRMYLQTNKFIGSIAT